MPSSLFVMVTLCQEVSQLRHLTTFVLHRESSPSASMLSAAPQMGHSLNSFAVSMRNSFSEMGLHPIFEINSTVMLFSLSLCSETSLSGINFTGVVGFSFERCFLEMKRGQIRFMNLSSIEEGVRV